MRLDKSQAILAARAFATNHAGRRCLASDWQPRAGRIVGWFPEPTGLFATQGWPGFPGHVLVEMDAATDATTGDGWSVTDNASKYWDVAFVVEDADKGARRFWWVPLDQVVLEVPAP